MNERHQKYKYNQAVDQLANTKIQYSRVKQEGRQLEQHQPNSALALRRDDPSELEAAQSD